MTYLYDLASQIAELRARKIEVTLVSSGAIGAGCSELGLPRRPKDVADLQAVAAVGQRCLMTHIHQAFEKHGLTVAQLLLTRGDFDDRVRYLNIRNCVTHLHRLGCVPVVNENDTVAVDELRFIDSDQMATTMENDVLAALMCNALRSDALILLSIVDGLFDQAGRTIDLVEDASTAIGLAHAGTSGQGSGGMATKLEAARMVTEAGEIAVIAHGRQKRVLPRLFEAECLGTVFAPAARKLDSRRRWIGLTKRAAGTVTIDDGAVTAVTARGKSLLARGIVATAGQFERGDVLLIRGETHGEIARGLSNYSAAELAKIMGKKSNQFERILGRLAYAEVIHRDNLVVTGKI